VLASQSRGTLSFLEETLTVEVIGTQMRGHPLESNGALQPDIVGAINLAHTTSSEPASDQKAASHGSGQGIVSGSDGSLSGWGLRHL